MPMVLECVLLHSSSFLGGVNLSSIKLITYYYTYLRSKLRRDESMCPHTLWWNGTIIQVLIYLLDIINSKIIWLYIHTFVSSYYEGQSVNRYKTQKCDIWTWKNMFFLNTSSANTDILVPLLFASTSKPAA
jgi:hypothetical protein